jgi:hypothetical protein
MPKVKELFKIRHVSLKFLYQYLVLGLLYKFNIQGSQRGLH